MDNQEIIEGNELIADFMKSLSPDLHYHSSWNWLMPVVEKIEELDNVYDVEIHPNGICSIFSDETFEKGGENTIEALWLTVVSFIKWYNLNK